jgi:hypothetical protein
MAEYHSFEADAPISIERVFALSEIPDGQPDPYFRLPVSK